jgi:hypothetical protein
MLIIHGVKYISFQPRLALISKTLVGWHHSNPCALASYMVSVLQHSSSTVAYALSLACYPE